MTDEQKEKITELLAKILLGMKGAKTFFEALIDDNVKGTIEVNASKIIRAITGSEEAVEEAVEDVQEAAEEVVEEVKEEVEEAAAEIVAAEPEEGTLIDQMDSWHWRTFACRYVDEGDGNPHYEDDEMAEFLESNPEWYKDTAMMAGWEEGDAPFGDRINASIAAETPWTSDPDNNHGIMVYKTFNVENVSEDAVYDLYMFYDNTVYCYINGEPFFILDGNLVSTDWNGDYDRITNNQNDKTLREFLHEGENYIAVSLKDAWGGREFDAYIGYEIGSTKRSIEMIPQGAEWQYTVFYAPYIDGEGNVDGGAAGGHFEPDEMADYIAAHPDYMSDTATASSWPTGRAPMSSGAEGWTGSNHGLFVYKSFTVDNLDEIKTADEFNFFGDYDNAIHVFLNGVEIYVDDGECVTQDWQSGINVVLDKDLILSTLKEGENYLFATVKDAWGGRDWNCGFRAFWN